MKRYNEGQNELRGDVQVLTKSIYGRGGIVASQSALQEEKISKDAVKIEQSNAKMGQLGDWHTTGDL